MPDNQTGKAANPSACQTTHQPHILLTPPHRLMFWTITKRHVGANLQMLFKRLPMVRSVERWPVDHKESSNIIVSTNVNDFMLLCISRMACSPRSGLLLGAWCGRYPTRTLLFFYVSVWLQSSLWGRQLLRGNHYSSREWGCRSVSQEEKLGAE